MRIVIAGGTGFLGSPLAEVYAEEGHDVRVLTRSLPAGESRHEPGTGKPGVTHVGWRPDGSSGPWARVIDGADAVINLAGASIAQRRRTPHPATSSFHTCASTGKRKRNARDATACASSCSAPAWRSNGPAARCRK